jgi:hypothetical protein
MVLDCFGQFRLFKTIESWSQLPPVSMICAHFILSSQYDALKIIVNPRSCQALKIT